MTWRRRFFCWISGGHEWQFWDFNRENIHGCNAYRCIHCGKWELRN